MKREIQIGRSVYLADDTTRTFVLVRKVLFRKNTEKEEENKWSISGYARIFSDGSK